MTSRDFADYKVVSLVNNCEGSCYCVEEKVTGRFYVWEAVDYELLSYKGKELLISDIKKLLDVNHQHAIRCVNYVDHQATATIYLVKEYCNGSAETLIKKCKATNSFIDEVYIWRIIYQSARAAHAMHSKGPGSVVLDFTAAGLHLDDDANVKVDFHMSFREEDADKRSNRSECTGSSRDGSERRHRKSDTHALGVLIQSMATLDLRNQKKTLPTHYSPELRSIIDLMTQSNPDKRPTIEGVLYHPSLVSQVVSSSLQQISLSEPAERQIDNTTICRRCKENEGKLSFHKKKESALKVRETEIKEKEKLLLQREKRINLLEQLAKEKMNRAEICRSRNGGDGRPPDDLNSSSYSADPGDTSLQPTIAKMEPSRIMRPRSLMSSSSSRRSVRFETIPEFEEPLKTEKDHLTWLRNKRNRYKGGQAMKELKSLKRDKENFEPKSVASSQISMAHSSTKENQRGILETFFR